MIQAVIRKQVSSQSRVLQSGFVGALVGRLASTTSTTSTTPTGASTSENKVIPMDSRKMYKYLQLESFQEEEFESVFDKIRRAPPPTKVRMVDECG